MKKDCKYYESGKHPRIINMPFCSKIVDVPSSYKRIMVVDPGRITYPNCNGCKFYERKKLKHE